MSKRLTDEERAELVAYLDNEIGGEAKRAIEAKLSRDPVWRAEAESLKRTWDLLDYLPKPEPKADFTQRTMSKIGPVRKPEGAKVGGPQPMRRWLLVGAVWAATVMLALGVGYSVCRAMLPHRPGD